MSVFRLLRDFLFLLSSRFDLKQLLKKKVFASIVGLVALLTVRYYTIKWYRRYKKYPPGPIGLPIIGSLLLLKRLKKLTCQLPFKYGSVIYTTVGNKHFVLVNNSKIFKQLAKRKDFTSRPIDFGKIIHNTPGFAFINNHWNERRLEIKKSLVNVVSRTNDLENNISQLLNNKLYNALNDCIKNNKLFYGKIIFGEISLYNMLFTAFGNAEYSNELCNKYTVLSNKWLERFTLGLLPLYINYLKYLFKSYIKETIRLEHEMEKIIKQLINKMANNSFASNILSKNNNTYNKLLLNDKIADIIDMLVASVTTTSHVLQIGLILLSMNLTVQNEVRNELLNVFKNGKFTLQKLKQCPKLEALVYECIRLSNVLHIGVPHTILKDLKINIDSKEYIIPKHSIIFENLSYIHDISPYENWKPVKRKSKYDLSNTINLDNFLEKDNLTNELKFKMNSSFMYFGYGKRDCIGKQLAIKQIQFIFGQLLVNYKFKLPKNNKIEQIKFKVGRINTFEPIGLVIEKV